MISKLTARRSGHPALRTHKVEIQPVSATFCIQIVRGATNFPLRPISSNRFLIGADAECDLQLGEASIPPLHSMIHIEEDGKLWMETVAPAPPLSVNGRPEQAVVLVDGDRIQIGSVQMTVQTLDASIDQSILPEHSTAQPLIDIDRLMAESTVQQRLEPLSANELADLIDAEQEQVERFESRQRMGAETMIHAALAQAAGDASSDGSLQSNASGTPKLPSIDDSVVSEFPEVLPFNAAAESTDSEDLCQLQGLLHQLEEITARTAGQTVSGLHRSDNVATDRDVREQLVAQLQLLLTRLQNPHSGDTDQNRAIA